MFLNVNFSYIDAHSFFRTKMALHERVGQLECLLGTQSSIRSLNFLYMLKHTKEHANLGCDFIIFSFYSH
jgi:hypothetical protein